MYTLLSGLYKQYTQKEEYYVIILGLDNAGKTTLLEKIKSIYMGVAGLPPEKIAPTVGLNIGKVDMPNNSRVNFWDLGGQRELHSIWEKYYTECHAIVFVVDSTDSERIEEVKDTFDRVISNDIIEGVPVLMLANKQDHAEALKVHDIKELFNPIAVKLGARDSKVLPVSALAGDGVREAIDWLCTRLERNKTNRPPVFRNR
ncbi:ADP-ribosylation factor protein 3 [Rhizophlyctis rosea]|uniref:ADP-ribosylation factor protein 3 n=1 Tax=Rhizophlyctis rosea TaxID=64517 RepID=A0AAD5SIP6_9FUNG|nr:ADP-ribosylation factor protein 3 [Rhizophlyctis rosea]